MKTDSKVTHGLFATIQGGKGLFATIRSPLAQHRVLVGKNKRHMKLVGPCVLTSSFSFL